MGEKIKDITKIKLHDMEVNIELNDGNAASRKSKYIHIQNDRFRLEVTDSEFLQLAMAVRVAANKLRKYKKIKS